ncbi:MAG: hypothetical protein QOI38_791, partial [Sphingomonadales bacterium]|nr:hypothetical protein [Sphingomonadales bacterium]
PCVFDGQPVALHSFQMLMGGLVIPSLRISYLIDESALGVTALIKARDGHSTPEPLPPPRAAEGPLQEKVSTPAANEQGHLRVLDDLLELSPLILRAEDVFETYKRRTGKPWKGRSSSKGAEQFAAECFGRPASYRDVEGRKKNDGYFFDPQYDQAGHQAVRSHLLMSHSKVTPLIASDRTRLVPILDLVHDPSVASGFTMESLCRKADAAKISYYERYLRTMLYALVAVNGVLGENEGETDISAILKGTMRVNPEESRTDRLNFLQRGILYLLTDDDNRLPDLFVAQMGWMFQLPRTLKVREAITRAHLDWLAAV